MGDSAGFKYHAGGAAKGIGYEVDSSPTLTADYHQPAVMSVRTANTSANGHGIADEVTHTLGGANGQAVAFEQNQRGEVRLNGGDGTLAGALASSPAQTKGQGASLVMTQFGDVAGTLSARADSSPCVDRGQNVVFQNATIGDCGLARESDDCSYAQYAASNGNPIYEYVCCSCGHRFASADGPIENEMDEDWFKIACPKCGSGRYADASKVKVICAADDNGKTAVEEDMCGSLKVGGGSP